MFLDSLNGFSSFSLRLYLLGLPPCSSILFQRHWVGLLHIMLLLRFVVVTGVQWAVPVLLLALIRSVYLLCSYAVFTLHFDLHRNYRWASCFGSWLFIDNCSRIHFIRAWCVIIYLAWLPILHVQHSFYGSCHLFRSFVVTGAGFDCFIAMNRGYLHGFGYCCGVRGAVA